VPVQRHRPKVTKVFAPLFQKAAAFFLNQAQTFTVDVALPDVVGAVVVEEMTWPSGFVTVVVTAPLESFVTVAVSTAEDDGAEEAASDDEGTAAIAASAAVAEPVAPGVAVGEPGAAMALRLAVMLMISSPNPSRACNQLLTDRSGSYSIFVKIRNYRLRKFYNGIVQTPRIASIFCQITAARFTPSKRAICWSPVGEVTLISVR
jgi:hypothetical protein